MFVCRFAWPRSIANPELRKDMLENNWTKPRDGSRFGQLLKEEIKDDEDGKTDEVGRGWFYIYLLLCWSKHQAPARPSDTSSVLSHLLTDQLCNPLAFPWLPDPHHGKEERQSLLRPRPPKPRLQIPPPISKYHCYSQGGKRSFGIIPCLRVTIESASHWLDRILRVNLMHERAILSWCSYPLLPPCSKERWVEHDVSTLPPDSPRQRSSCANFSSLPYSQIHVMPERGVERCRDPTSPCPLTTPAVVTLGTTAVPCLVARSYMNNALLREII